MKRPGLQFKAIDLNRCSEMPELLTAQDLELLIEVAASFMDVESSAPAGPAAKNIKNELLGSRVFSNARSTLFRILGPS